MNLYLCVYSQPSGQVLSVYVVASTSDNAWAAVQASDPTAQALETQDELYANVIVGS